MSLNSIKSGLKSCAYALGLLAWWHRRRNANALTVFMFHRVLPRDSAAYAKAEREFTFSTEGFGRCLDFIGRHYSIVTPAELARAIEAGEKLPPCPALITFDDGWRDTLVHAYPQLKARGMTALIFLATEILEAQSPQWWQDMLVGILAEPERSRTLLRRLGLPEEKAQARSRELDHEIAGLVAALPLTERLDVLASIAADSGAEPQMLTEAELIGADRDCVEFGAHGHTHAPLTTVAIPEAELQRSQTLVGALQPSVPSMSFPHGAYTEQILALSHQAGFKLVFTSDPTLLSMQQTRARKIGRIHIPENEWTTEGGRISFPKLATFLFFRPHVSS